VAHAYWALGWKDPHAILHAVQVFLCTSGRPTLMHASDRLSIPFWHPRITTAYKANMTAPATHQEYIQLFSGDPAKRKAGASPYCADIVPAGHPNFSTLIANPGKHPLPPDHPIIEPWIGNMSTPSYTPYRCVH
jgi:hypothetical protein